MSVPLGKGLRRKSDGGGGQIVAINSVRMVDTNANVFRDRVGNDGARPIRFLRV